MTISERLLATAWDPSGVSSVHVAGERGVLIDPSHPDVERRPRYQRMVHFRRAILSAAGVPMRASVTGGCAELLGGPGHAG